MDDLIFRLFIFGFITEAMMIVAGAFWADALWGSYWSWDPVETWALINWLMYGVFIHLRLIHKWRGTRLAWLSIIGLIIACIAYWVSDEFTARGHVGNITG